jgi:hypothetical protein
MRHSSVRHEHFGKAVGIIFLAYMTAKIDGDSTEPDSLLGQLGCAKTLGTPGLTISITSDFQIMMELFAQLPVPHSKCVAVEAVNKLKITIT